MQQRALDELIDILTFTEPLGNAELHDSTMTVPTSETIHTNKKHPFFTEEQGFVPVGQLKLGMHVLRTVRYIIYFRASETTSMTIAAATMMMAVKMLQLCRARRIRFSTMTRASSAPWRMA